VLSLALVGPAWRRQAAFAVVLAVLGFGLVAAASNTRAQRRRDQPRQSRLVQLILDRRQQLSDLDAAVRKLRAEVVDAQLAASKVDSASRDRANRLLLLGQLAGTSTMEGPGLVVRLSDSTRKPTSKDEAGAFRIHDVDLQLVVNQLFAAGAEAVSVNDNRLVTTSPIRAAGDTIVVNFRPLNPPYVVTAIGARRTAFDGSPIARRFERWRDLFGLGYTLRAGSKLRVAGFAGRVAVDRAQPVGAGG
jgi:uncharacterized protein YlxW (UPF0749 family)